MRDLLIFLSLILAGNSAFPQPIGYQNIFVTDSARTYKPKAHPGDRLYYRPLEIDLWYPATTPGPDPPIRYGEYLSLLEQRSNRFQNDTVFTNLTAETVQYLCAGLDIPDTTLLTRLKTSSYRNTQPENRSFPLIIYLCSYNGISYENINLFEYLVGHGYTIACITSVGRYPGNMTTDPADLLEQVQDAVFTLRYLANRRGITNAGIGLIDTANIGLIGYSWGGLAAITLAMKINAKAIVSLDGSERHYYGASKVEDSNFNRLRTAPFFQPDNIHAPYAYLESGNKQADRPTDSIFNPLPLPGQIRSIRFPDAEHEDFSCLPLLAAHIGGIDSTHLDRYIRFSLDFFDRYVKDRSDVFPAADSSIIFLDKKSARLSEVTVTSKPPRSKRLGNTTRSKFMSVGFPLRSPGTEMGVKINLGSHPKRLKTFNFNISGSRIDSAIFQFHIYSLGTDTPKNILKREVFLPIGKRTGAYSIDLASQKLVLKGDILVSLQLVRNLSTGPDPGVLFFSAGLLNSATWRRPASRGDWKKAGGIGIGFNIDVQ